MKHRFLIAFLALLSLMVSCKWENPEGQGKFKITTTTNILADGVRALVRDSAAVTPLMAIGVDPHLYKASQREDRKSTRLNSSHVKISYAVFCLKKKKS